MDCRLTPPRWLLTVLTACAAACAKGQLFSQDEVERIQSFWSVPDRYTMNVPKSALKSGLWQVRLTVSGSKWLWNYNKARGIVKANPAAAAPPPQSVEQAEWEKWIDAKVDWDRRTAQTEANRLNASVLTGFKPPVVNSAPNPGPPPNRLIALAGAPPPFAEATIPIEHRVKFDDVELAYVDNVPMKPRYAYYRFEKGVMSGGQRVRDLPAEQIEPLFLAAGIGATERKVMGAVSLLEGGFDSVNTYDTGFVSIGFIQFASLKDGAGSLGRMMARMKAAEPQAFEDAFRRFGVDVSAEGRLVALDLDLGVEVVGPEANTRIIEDRRLVSVFQRAGLKCREFRIAQLQSAFQDYYPAEDVVAFQAGGRTLSFKVRDIVRSEAGLATLMDRKVNTGTLDPLPFVLSLISAETGATTAADLQKYERDIVLALRYRRDYLADSTLTQPGKAMAPDRDYRHASRKDSSRSGRSCEVKGGSSGGKRAAS